MKKRITITIEGPEEAGVRTIGAAILEGAASAMDKAGSDYTVTIKPDDPASVIKRNAGVARAAGKP